MPTPPLIGLTYSTAELSEFRLWPRMFHGVVTGGGVDVDPSVYGGDVDDSLVTVVNAQRDEFEMAVLAAARHHGKPILAICRGAQLVNVALGGTLHADLERDRPSDLQHRDTADALAATSHSVELSAGSLLAQWNETDGSVEVNSNHHQGIKDLAESLTATAVAPDGLIEGFELPAERLVGVQWHPEVLWPAEPHALSLLTNFIHACTP